MVDRKSKYTVSARDKISSIGGNILLNIIFLVKTIRDTI